MTAVPWLPPWPSSWPDWIAGFQRGIWTVIPQGLVSEDGQAAADWESLAEMLGHVREMMDWIYHSITPQTDTESLQLARWRQDLQVKLGDGGASVADWIVAKLRQRGTLTDNMIRQIMCTAWGSLDPSILTIYRQPLLTAGTEPTDELQRRENWQIHIYHAAETQAPDWRLAEALIAAIKPTWEIWSVGRYKLMRRDDPDSGWDRGVWGP